MGESGIIIEGHTPSLMTTLDEYAKHGWHVHTGLIFLAQVASITTNYKSVDKHTLLRHYVFRTIQCDVKMVQWCMKNIKSALARYSINKFLLYVTGENVDHEKRERYQKTKILGCNRCIGRRHTPLHYPLPHHSDT